MYAHCLYNTFKKNNLYQRRFQAEAIVLVYQYPQKLGDVKKIKIKSATKRCGTAENLEHLHNEVIRDLHASVSRFSLAVRC